jgi:uncharacterized protein YbaP (TraB family)
MRTVVALAFLTLLSNASAAFAAPSLWVIKSPSATVYLFGTIHLLRASQDWETQAIKDALPRIRSPRCCPRKISPV